MSDNYFDFNNVDARFLDLGTETAQYVADALEAPVGSRTRAVAALAAARRVMLHFAGDGLGYESAKALTGIANDLERVEYALRDLEDGAAPAGLTAPLPDRKRPPESNAAVDFQARAVAAVIILRQLPGGPLSKDAAVSLVAPAIPRALLKPHPNTGPNYEYLSQEEQLVAWLDAFGRKGSRRYARLRALWDALSIEGGGFHKETTAKDVIAWLKDERDRLLSDQ